MDAPHPAWVGTFADHLGMTYEQVSPGHAVAHLTLEAHHLNPNGVCHGGAIFTLADDCMGAAVSGLPKDGLVPTSTQLNIHFMKSARPGITLRAETSVVSSGRRTAVLKTDVSDERGRAVALVTSSYLFVEARYPVSA
ncbi:MAG: PaaI family thioesterase [Myxococcales bacterium]|nr:PaaI family thioesterase [Myxococcales bacterium]